MYGFNSASIRRKSYGGHRSYSNPIPKKYRKKPIPVKRIAVRKSHASILEISKKFNIPCVPKAFGEGIVRVCCRTVAQLDNISLILNELFKFNLIQEIGMPMKYAYQMKTLVLFIKPTNMDSKKKLDRVFQKCVFEYHHILIDSDYPSIAQTETVDQKVDFTKEEEEATEIISEDEMLNKQILKTAEEEDQKLETILFICKILIFLATIFLLFKI